MKTNRLSNMNYNQVKMNPSFKGGVSSEIGKKVLTGSAIKKVSDLFEFDKFTMSLVGMMTLLYGATIIPRYIQATDKHDRREILTRDFLSITSILFAAKGISRGISKLCTKLSGFALTNTSKEVKDANILKKVWHYLNPAGGVNVLNSHEIVSKYSKLENYPNKIADFARFIREQGGDIRKVLSSNKRINKHAENVLGKDFKSQSIDTVEQKLNDLKDSNLMKPIYNEFENPDNSFVKKAKTMNSSFDFLSTILLVPGFMMWIEKFNEKVTKKKIAEEQSIKDRQLQDASKPVLSKVIKTAQNSSDVDFKSTYAYFLGDSRAK